jgi:hypothetical protein
MIENVEFCCAGIGGGELCGKPKSEHASIASVTCPTCGQNMPGDLIWTVKERDDGQYEVSVTDGKYRGWALRKDEDEARFKALARLHYYRDLGKGKWV